MKSKISFIFLMMLIGLGCTTAVNSQQGDLIDQGCRQGSCWDIFLLEKRLIHQDNLGGQDNRLYEVDQEHIIDDSDSVYQVSWVYCALNRPYIAFLSSGHEDNEFVILHTLSPANSSEIFGYNQSGYNLYWAVCHDQFNVDPYSMVEKAKELDYFESLNSGQIELPVEFFKAVLNQ